MLFIRWIESFIMIGGLFSIRMGFIDPGQIHDVLMAGLSYNTKYYYQVGQ